MSVELFCFSSVTIHHPASLVVVVKFEVGVLGWDDLKGTDVIIVFSHHHHHLEFPQCNYEGKHLVL